MPKDFRRIPPDQLRWYNGLDVSATLSLYRDQLNRAGVFEDVWRRLHGPALHALGVVERWGALLSEPNVRTYDAFLQAKIAKVKEGLRPYKAVPADLNVKSPQQLHKLIGEKLKLKSPYKTDSGGPSYGDDALKEMAAAQLEAGNSETAALLEHLRDYLAARSMLASYGVGQLKHVGFDGRVHTTYKMSRSARLRSAKPNLQNLKSPDDDPDLAEEDDDGKWARGCWVCPEGTVMVNLDYSQNELRVAALLSGDEAMIADFNSGVDFHFRTASRVFAKAPEVVTKLERRVAKIINFRTIFGGTDYGLAAMLKITEEKASEYSRAYFEGYPRLAAYLRHKSGEVAATGSSWGKWPREGWIHRRETYEAGETGRGKGFDKMRGHAERVGQNNEIQWLANCFGLAALTRTVAWIEDTGIPVQLVMTVHDNLVLYARRDVWEEAARQVRRIMTSFDTGPVPLVVDVEMGERDLGHLLKVKLAQ